jgi:transposase
VQIFNLPYHRINNISDERHSQESYKKKAKLDLYERLITEGCSRNTALEAINTTRSTYYRWKRKYRNGGIEALKNKDRTPHNIRKPTWNNDLEELVFRARKKYKIWGKGKIREILEREHNVNLSESMVGRMISGFLKQGAIKPVEFYFGKIKRKKKRSFTGYAQRWKYGMKSGFPGDLIQVDHATIRLDSGKIVKHFKAVCPTTKYAVEQAYHSATSFVGERFFKLMRQRFPFEMKSIQVDGGSEFMGDFEQICKEQSVKLFVLPPRRPQYNGTVERGHAITKYEFYFQYYGSNNLDEIREKLYEYTVFYNTFRPLQRLHYETPLSYYRKWVS